MKSVKKSPTNILLPGLCKGCFLVTIPSIEVEFTVTGSRRYRPLRFYGRFWPLSPYWFLYFFSSVRALVIKRNLYGTSTDHVDQQLPETKVMDCSDKCIYVNSDSTARQRRHVRKGYRMDISRWIRCASPGLGNPPHVKDIPLSLVLPCVPPATADHELSTFLPNIY